MNSVNHKSFLMETTCSHYNARFLALPGEGALSNQLEIIYLHTISGSECSFFYAEAEKILSHQVGIGFVVRFLFCFYFVLFSDRFTFLTNYVPVFHN